MSATIHHLPVRQPPAAPSRDRTTWTRSASPLEGLSAGLLDLGVTPAQIAALGLPLEETLALDGSAAVLEAPRPALPYPA